MTFPGEKDSSSLAACIFYARLLGGRIGSISEFDGDGRREAQTTVVEGHQPSHSFPIDQKIMRVGEQVQTHLLR